MDTKRYEHISTGCLVIAIVATLLYQELDAYQALSLLIVIAAALCSVVVYFVKQLELNPSGLIDMDLYTNETGPVEIKSNEVVNFHLIISGAKSETLALSTEEFYKSLVKAREQIGSNELEYWGRFRDLSRGAYEKPSDFRVARKVKFAKSHKAPSLVSEGFYHSEHPTVQ